MSARIVPPAAPPIATTKVETDETHKAKEAGKGFEAIFVRQMLASAKVAGKSGYADMGVEAIASAVTAGGGIGLGRAIEDALAAHHPHPAPVKTPPNESIEKK